MIIEHIGKAMSRNSHAVYQKKKTHYHIGSASKPVTG